MSILSAATEQQVEDSLVKQGLLTKDKLEEYRAKAQGAKVPVLAYLVNEKVIGGESLTKTTAQITKIPYVNLVNAKLDASTLSLLPRDIAERYMAVPLGEMQRRLVVAMLEHHEMGIHVRPGTKSSTQILQRRGIVPRIDDHQPQAGG